MSFARAYYSVGQDEPAEPPPTLVGLPDELLHLIADRHLLDADLLPAALRLCAALGCAGSRV